MLVLLCIVQGCLLVYVNALVRTVTCPEQRAENFQIARDANQVQRVLILRVLGFDIGVVFDK